MDYGAGLHILRKGSHSIFDIGRRRILSKFPGEKVKVKFQTIVRNTFEVLCQNIQRNKLIRVSFYESLLPLQKIRKGIHDDRSIMIIHYSVQIPNFVKAINKRIVLLVKRNVNFAYIVH